METAAKPTPHPAKFSDVVMMRIQEYLLDIPTRPLNILDPYAGIGGVHRLHNVKDKIATYGIELEPEWASQHPSTICGDARDLLDIMDVPINCIVTSPSYGNRMADHHNAKDSSTRITYKHKLGRDLSEGSSAVMQWGESYRSFHWDVWGKCTRLIGHSKARAGWFILNCKDHVRSGVVQEVTLWHVECLAAMGWELINMEIVDTPGMGFGANREKRAEEWVALLKYDRPS